MNIRVDLVYPISDGSPVTFKSPCDCSEVTGLIVYSPESVGSKNIISTEFIFADAHKNDVSEMAELFTEGVIVKLILDVTHNIAYVQNADTNAYLEGKFEETREFTVEKIAESKKYVDDRVTESIEYVDRQITLVNASGIPKLGIYFFQETATEDGQTVFPIGLGSFDIDTDTVLVDSGRTKLSHVSDYVVNADKTITLTEGVPKGRTIDITIMKHIPMGEEGEVNGVIMARGSIPLDRLVQAVALANHTHTPSEAGASPVGHTHTPSEAGAVAKTGDSMTGALNISHKDGVNTIRPAADMNNSQPEHKNQLSIVANGNTVINRWKWDATQNKYVHLSALYIGDKVLSLFNASENKTYNMYGTHNITYGTGDVTSGSSALASSNIHLVHE